MAYNLWGELGGDFILRAPLDRSHSQAEGSAPLFHAPLFENSYCAENSHNRPTRRWCRAVCVTTLNIDHICRVCFSVDLSAELGAAFTATYKRV